MHHRDPRGVPTRGEERELVRRAQAGDLEARGELVLRHYGLIRRTARRYSQERADVSDFTAAATAGFLLAIDKFDLARDVRLTTYASRWMFREMQVWLAGMNLVHIPAWLYRRDLGVFADRPIEEIAPEHWPHVLAARQAVREPHPLTPLAAIAQDQSSYDPPDDRLDDPSDAIERDDLIDHVLSLVEQLDARSRDLVCRRFGLAGHRAHSFTEIADACGFSKSRAEQIVRRAIGWLRNAMCEKVALSPSRNAYMGKSLRQKSEAAFMSA